MKKRFCFLLAVLLFLSSAVFAEESGDGTLFSMDAGGEKEDAFTQSDDLDDDGHPRSYADLAATGPYVWQVMDGCVRCTDVRTRKQAAELPLSSLYTGTEDRLELTAFGDTVTLCAVVNAGADCRVTLYQLVLQDGAIVPSGTVDATEKLSFLYGPAAGWMETDLIACAGGLLVTALDREKVYQLSLYDPASGTITELGTYPLAEFTAVVAFGDRLLIAGAPISDPETLNLTGISLPSGEREVVGTVRTGTLSPLDCFALNEAEQSVYYYVDSVGYRAKIGPDAVPEPFCTMQAGAAPFRYGLISGGWYVSLDEEGRLLYQDAAAVMQSVTLRVLDLTGADLSAFLQTFNSSNPDYLAVVTAGEEEDDILTPALNQSPDYDAYILNLGSNQYQALFAKGYLGDLGGSTILTDAVRAYPERILSRIRTGDRLTAFPLGIQNTALLLDVEAVSRITGLSREEIPTDWTGFLNMLGTIGEDGLLDGSGRILYESGLSADAFRIDLLSMILQDAMLWLNQDEARLSALQAALTPALRALDGTDWLKLGLPEDDEEEGGWISGEETPALMEWVNPEIGVMNIRDGMELWPLSLAEGGERLIPQDVFVIVLNPWSAHPDGVVRLTEALCGEMDVITRMELDAGLNEPVVNNSYDDDVKYMRSLIPVYEQAVAEAKTDEEAESLQAELDDIAEYLADYEKYGSWLASAESIERYRSLEDLFVIHGDEFWADESQSMIFFQYADGLLDADQFVRQLTSTLQMARMEAE